ncbi:hypothetical protein HMPREF3226_01264 [Prevotella corporis]|uniref:Uncharacterized protein n=1 Tax=Prevotella corporis TaxID=28128 RepID=A0A133Q9A6_9BACT|nr:hypothetical protein HMPREF3226_01264 [Prevotella corporis]
MFYVGNGWRWIILGRQLPYFLTNCISLQGKESLLGSHPMTNPLYSIFKII